VRLTVLYFASMREALGTGESLDLPAGTTLGELRDRLIASSPQHATALGRGRALRCAVDRRLVADEGFAICGDAEVAFFPPVTGG
jgi:sulfur-carrier protein